MLQTMIPALAGFFGALIKDRKNIATSARVGEDVVQRVLGAAEAYVSKEERLQQLLYQQVQDARAHDAATFDKTDVAANRLRSSVRPIVTFVAMGWYVYARIEGIELMPEDYAIIGGVLAFWFGFRPFEKIQLKSK